MLSSEELVILKDMAAKVCAHDVAEVSGLQDGFDFPDDVSNGYLLSDGQLGNLREKVRAELETKLAEGHMLSSEELVILKDMATKSCADF